MHNLCLGGESMGVLSCIFMFAPFHVPHGNMGLAVLLDLPFFFIFLNVLILNCRMPVIECTFVFKCINDLMDYLMLLFRHILKQKGKHWRQRRKL